MRVLKWIVDRCRGPRAGRGNRARRDAALRGPQLERAGASSTPARFEELARVDEQAWSEELKSHDELFGKLRRAPAGGAGNAPRQHAPEARRLVPAIKRAAKSQHTRRHRRPPAAASTAVERNDLEQRAAGVNPMPDAGEQRARRPGEGFGRMLRPRVLRHQHRLHDQRRRHGDARRRRHQAAKTHGCQRQREQRRRPAPISASMQRRTGARAAGASCGCHRRVRPRAANAHDAEQNAGERRAAGFGRISGGADLERARRRIE